jgi:regulation of enolase protein 1 (concanavalin A-like superfamily)
VDFSATFDAGVLILWSDEGHFAKLCYEQSPQHRPMVVSVVTREVSDDANAVPVEGDSVWLRISGLTDHVYAFHASSDGAHWDMVRYFRLDGTRPMAYGISVQSPVGEGCAVRFEDLALTHDPLPDLRDGS